MNQAGSNHLSSSNNRLNTTENRQESSVKEITCSRRVKDLLLSRHLKKERSNDMNARITKDFSFNTNGYFHQSVSGFQRTTKRNKSFIKELFHQRNSSGYNTKLI